MEKPNHSTAQAISIGSDVLFKLPRSEFPNTAGQERPAKVVLATDEIPVNLVVFLDASDGKSTHTFFASGVLEGTKEGTWRRPSSIG